MNETLVAELARIDGDQRRALLRAVREERYELIRAALQRVRVELLASYSERAAAILIDDAAHDRRNGELLALKAQIKAMLIQELRHLNDVPGWERIRQLIA